jgi:hypothetical protein
MFSWLPTHSPPPVSFEVTLARHQLRDLLRPVTAITDQAVFDISSEELRVRGVDDERVQSVSAAIEADACPQYTAADGTVEFEVSTLWAALTADAVSPSATDPVRLAYSAEEEILTVDMSTIIHEQPATFDPEVTTPQPADWPTGATVYHQVSGLADVCSYFAEITDTVSISYDKPADLFRIESLTSTSSGNPRHDETGVYERSSDDLPKTPTPAAVEAVFGSHLLATLLSVAPNETLIQLQIVDEYPLRLQWAPIAEDGNNSVEVTALLAPRTNLESDSSHS